MTQLMPVVFLLDVDNTLLDNDAVTADLRRHLTHTMGTAHQERYWTIFEALREELGYADYLGALQRFRAEHPREPTTARISSYLLSYPFASRLYPSALEVVDRLSAWGPTVIFSDGDVVFQPRKIERAGLAAAVDDRVLIYIHKETELEDVEKRYPARHYVLVDDKRRILSAAKKIWGARLTTVWPRQGHYAHDPEVGAKYPPADLSMDAIAALTAIDLRTLIAAGAPAAAIPAAYARQGDLGRLIAPDPPKNVLVVDVGGSHVKILATGHKTPRAFVSGPSMAPEAMVAGVLQAAVGWNYDAVSMGYPGAVLLGRPIAEPHNLGPGWVGFDYKAAFGCDVKIVNDAVLQALGGYGGGKMLFLGLGTGLGSAMIVNGIVEPMELGHLPYKKGTYEDYVGLRGLERFGKKKWRHYVTDVVTRLVAALEPEDVVLGGGNADKLAELPSGTRLGHHASAFRGGFRLWTGAGDKPALAVPPAVRREPSERRRPKETPLRRKRS